MFEAHSHHRDPIEAKLQSKPSPGLRPPSPGGRGTKSLLPPGEGAAQRRMRGGAAPRPVPPLTRPSARLMPNWQTTVHLALVFVTAAPRHWRKNDFHHQNIALFAAIRSECLGPA